MISGHDIILWGESPNPNYPSLFKPQENTFPDTVKKQVWKEPHATCFTFSSNCLNLTTIGLYSFGEMNPIPNYPLSPRPQDKTSPSTVKKQEWNAPHEISLI